MSLKPLPFTIVLAGCLSAAGRAAPARFDDYSVVRVITRTQHQVDQLEQTGVTILNCNYGPGRVDVAATAEHLSALDQLNLAHVILQPNLQRAIDAERRPAGVVAGAPDPYADFFLDYHPYDDGEGSILWFMNELESRYPSLVSPIEVGTTLLGRPIKGVKVTASTNPEAPAVVYFGAEHAREWITTTVPSYLARRLVENYGSDPDITDLMDHVVFYLVPVFNVDGYEYTWTSNRLWRKNRRGGYGVDINRNWGEGWGGPGSSGVTSETTYRGTAPFSEPETVAMRDFMINHPNLRAQLDVHNYGEVILWPFGYTPALSADDNYYAEVGAIMRTLIEDVHDTAFDLGPAYTAVYPASGVSIDWTYVHRDMLSISFECRDHGQYGFTLPADQIIPSNEELLPAILHMTNSQWVRDPARFQFPSGLPRTLVPGQPTTFTVEIVAQTQPIAPATASILYRYDPAAAFASAALTPLGGSLYQATLPPTNCSSQPEFYLRVETAGGAEVTHPSNVPAGFHKALMQTARSAFMFNNLSTNPGWAAEGQWQWGQPTGGGGEFGFHDPSSAFTGTTVYGYNLGGDYDNNSPQHRITTSGFNCAGRKDVRLDFMRWLGVEKPAWDRAGIEVSSDGENWTKVWRNSGEVADNAWTAQSIDLSAIADDQPTVYVRWTMGPTDSYARYCGWNIDDIALTEGLCEGLFGDSEGDADVDATDFDRFSACFSGAGVGAAPNCGVFDANADDDVDCDDWVEFHAAWTGPGSRPDSFPGCEDRAGPIVTAAGARYLSVTPPAGAEPVALRIASPQYPCFLSYIDVVELPDQAVVGRLVQDPVYRTPPEWGTVLVADGPIAPFTWFRVRTETAAGTASTSPEAQTLRWGDSSEAIGEVNVLDISGIVDRMKELVTAPPIARCDLNPLVPDHVVNVLDLARAVDALSELPYPFPPPANCP